VLVSRAAADTCIQIHHAERRRPRRRFYITRQLSFEPAPDVRVNVLAPGLVTTKLAAARWQGAGEDRIAEHIPLRRLGVPDDIATTALFLASEASSWVTGQTLVVDGGTTVQPSGGVG
jgi:NAD(P)-dependent dehydrogenase (short-subunit alcohol dehydrogenase family)